MDTFSVSSSDIQKRYKEVVERVKLTKQPVLLMNKQEPQAAIVSLEDLTELQNLRRRNSGKNLLSWAAEVRELLKGETLPDDLSAQHDYYLWEEKAEARS